MRVAILFAAVSLASAQPPDPAFAPLDRAYTALRAHDYDTAVLHFAVAIANSPRRADIRKDLAYTYLKIGEPTLARDQFHEAAAIDPADTNAALEYAFLCNETGQQAEARRILDRIRRLANPTLLAASRGGEPRASELARELLPTRYPFVPEFRAALALDAANHELRRELAYLLLRMGHEPEAETEFRILSQNAPDDLLSV